MTRCEADPCTWSKRQWASVRRSPTHAKGRATTSSRSTKTRANTSPRSRPMSNDFDEYRHTYRDEVQRSIDFSGQDVGFFTDVKARLLGELAERQFGKTGELTVLDVGCGVGLTDDALQGRFATIHGVDVSEGAVAEAAAMNPWATYASYEDRTLPFEDDRFDLAFAICVVHHVEPTERAA